MVNLPGRSSGSWFALLPAPSHLGTLTVHRSSLLARTHLAFHVVRLTSNVVKTVALTGFVPIYSGGTARDSHPLPLPGSRNVEPQ